MSARLLDAQPLTCAPSGTGGVGVWGDGGSDMKCVTREYCVDNKHLLGVSDAVSGTAG